MYKDTEEPGVGAVFVPMTVLVGARGRRAHAAQVWNFLRVSGLVGVTESFPQRTGTLYFGPINPCFLDEDP